MGQTHGAPEDNVRHVGDMGNVETDANGVAKGTITDSLIKLIGPTSVLGVCYSMGWRTPERVCFCMSVSGANVWEAHRRYPRWYR